MRNKVSEGGLCSHCVCVALCSIGIGLASVRSLNERKSASSCAILLMRWVL
ncbi:hypothetical protein PN836_016400 [Ningiella sp. W23]|uniref:hypothetical protein n=1 Tax=Ningiella sp. W23 TaxID=3023715 RepID=UPI003757A5CE